MRQKSKKKPAPALGKAGEHTGVFKPQNVKKIVSRIERLGVSLCESYGIELIHVECRREPNGRIIRVFIDKPGGVTLNDCVEISRQLNDLIDVHLEIESQYNLEVSSPGINRPLYKPHDFDKFSGNRVKIVTEEPLNGQRNFTGTLLGISREVVSLHMSGQDIAIPFEKITKAQLVHS